jgi:hypothetical protein
MDVDSALLQCCYNKYLNISHTCSIGLSILFYSLLFSLSCDEISRKISTGTLSALPFTIMFRSMKQFLSILNLIFLGPS